MGLFARALVLSACVLTASVAHALDGGLDPSMDGGIPQPSGGDAAFADAGEPLVVVPSGPSTPNVPGAIAVTVRKQLNEVQQRVRSSDAVTVVDLSGAHKRAADMGEVLARVQGVSLRRAGGLGSTTRFSLNGLYDDQVRFMLDGVPLEYAGFPFGIANSPVNLVERVEIYRGVVPIRLGSDALGGAVNMVTDQSRQTRARASYEIGSFGLHRVTLDARYKHERTGIVAGATGFFDHARNDYPIWVKLTEPSGQRRDAEVERLNDRYLAYGAMADVGVVDKRWADKLIVRGFLSGYDKELPHNISMTVPYGGVTYGERIGGVTADYRLTKRDLQFEAVANYSHRTIELDDRSAWVYDWRGNPVMTIDEPGQLGNGFEQGASASTIWQQSGFARAVLAYNMADGHVARASITPNYTARTGENRATPAGSRDPLDVDQHLLTLIAGLEYELAWRRSALAVADDGQFKNSLFVKSYTYRAHHEEWLDATTLRARDKNSQHFGAGDQLRIAVTRDLSVKLSYEYTTRLPRPDEAFGNGVLIQANPELKPERSHNANIGPRYELRRSPIGSMVIDVNAFLRKSEDLILPLQFNDRLFLYQNVYGARALGLEGQLRWTSPGRYVLLEFTPSWIEQRNTSSDGAFGRFKGDRLPNRPYLFGSWTAQLRFARVLLEGDAIESFYEGRWVHEFYRAWESQGRKDFKEVVERQISHDVGFVYSLQTGATRASLSFEIANVTDARVYDFFGVQRPGRGYYLKLTASL